MIQRKRAPRANPEVDANVGARIRTRRTLLGLTQEEVAASLAISNQQVQKYETGANRVSAGRLFQLAQLLGVDISYFFEGLEPSAVPERISRSGKDRLAIDLVRNFLEIASGAQRTAVANLVKTLKGGCQCDGDKKSDPSYGTSS